MGALIALALRQLSSARGFAAVLALGIVVAATLLASAPIYARAMADLGLTFTIRTDLEGRATSRAEFGSIALKSPEGSALRDTIERRIDERIGWFTESVQRSVRLGRFTVTTDGRPVGGTPPNAEPVALENYRDHVQLIEGRFPERRTDGVIEFAIGVETARAAQVALGDSLLLYQEFDNCEREIPGEGIPPPPPPCPITERVEFTFPVEIVGIIEPTAADDPFWPGTASRYFRPYYLPLNGVGPIVPVLAEPDAIREDFGSLYPSYRAYSIWSVQADTSVLTRNNFIRARDDLVDLYAEFEPLGGFAVSPLRDTLIGYGRTADYQQVPLLVLLLEITGIALFYIAIVASIVVERQTPEIALLRGRGASIWQILSMYLLQGLVIGIPTLIVAPFLAAGLTALLGLTPLFNDITDGELLPVTIVPMAFLTAALGIGLSLLALLLPAFMAARKGTAAVRKGISRPGFSFFQRYYLDVALAAVAGLLLFELQERGSVFTPSSTGGVSSDPLLLASPALAIAAAGALILRFYPMIIRLVARISRPVAGAAVTLGLIQVVRNAGQYTRLALLLMMVVAVGTFAASYTRTADRSYLDRANHEAGVDVRATTRNVSLLLGTKPEEFEARAEELPGVERASAVVRNEAAIATAGNSNTAYQVLGVDPSAAADMLTFREDLAERSLEDLMQTIDSPPALVGKQLPAGVETISLWAMTDTVLGGQNLRVGFRDGEGRYAMLLITPTEEIFPEWRQYTANISDLPWTPVEPLSVVTVILTGTLSRPGNPKLFLDDITVTTAQGAEHVVENFEDAPAWLRLPSVAPVPDNFEVNEDTPHTGARSAIFTIRSNVDDELRGIYIPAFLTPLPIVVSDSFIESTGLGEGSEFLMRVSTSFLVPVVVRGSFELFPTTVTRDGPVIVFNRDRLLTWVDIANPGFGPEPEQNEVWLSVDDGADVPALEATLRADPFKLERVTSRQETIALTTKNPLIAASGTGILSVAFIAVLGLAAAALLTSLLAAVRRRRVEFAVVQAIGLSRRQLLGMLALEYTIVFVIGVTAGCLLGLFVSDQMLSFLNVTETGERIEPGFILQTRWAVVALGVGIVMAAFSVALWLASRAVRQGNEASILRTE